MLEVVDGRHPETIRIDAASSPQESAGIVMTAQSVD
jgi:hypothetical protein